MNLHRGRRRESGVRGLGSRDAVPPWPGDHLSLVGLMSLLRWRPIMLHRRWPLLNGLTLLLVGVDRGTNRRYGGRRLPWSGSGRDAGVDAQKLHLVRQGTDRLFKVANNSLY